MSNARLRSSLDKSWLLNPAGIAAAKRCIHAVEQELGVRLKLSHPSFINMLSDYAELTQSEELQAALSALLSIAPADGHKQVQQQSKPKVFKLMPEAPKQDGAKQDRSKETIEYMGKRYPRFHGDGEFTGLYRGQPHYR